ncbi:MAG: hypothetical protein HYY79_04475 [Betaproteobacteria bacterium]|nr:hypothetical protein [Betaproteobacteria bacterium]
MKRHLNNLHAAFKQVFARFSYIAFAGVLALLAFLLAVWFPNLGLIAEVFSRSDAPLTAKLNVALSLLGGIGTNFSPLSAGYTVAITVLFGINAAMIVYLLRQKRAAAAGPIGSGGVMSGALGIGCAACGSLISGAVLPVLGAGGALAALPLDGGEFGILSVALLVVSLSVISKTIAEPIACSPAQTRHAQQP